MTDTFRFKVLSIGLANAPTSFQRLMDLVLAELTWEVCLEYMDDVAVMVDTFERHLERLKLVMERLKRAGLKLNSAKCKLFRLETKFLGNVVSRKMNRTRLGKGASRRRLPNTKEFDGSQGLRGSSHLLPPVHWLFRINCSSCPSSDSEKNKSLVWREAQQEASERLKGRYVLDSDASEEALGLVLQEEQDDMLKVIAYSSRALQPAERSYSTTRKELLAVICGLKHFRQILLGRRFACRTDHALISVSTSEPVGLQARYLDLLEEYDMEMVHRPGTLYQNSDA